MNSRNMKKLYLYVNIPFIIIFFILSFIPFVAITAKAYNYYLGLASRVLLGIWCIFNGLWNAGTDYYSFFKNNKRGRTNKAARWLWWLIFILGIVCIITTFTR